MNIFILNSGRCGSTTFIRACDHISNYSAGHESRVGRVGAQRLAYPARHIEADNRLSWILGRLDRRFGGDAFYVHLTREHDAVAASFAQRTEIYTGIIRAYREGILRHAESDIPAGELVDDYLETIAENINLFLRDKPRQMRFRLEHAEQDFAAFWVAIGAQGDRERALAEWTLRHNAGLPPEVTPHTA
jgi:hypothetical protein